MGTGNAIYARQVMPNVQTMPYGDLVSGRHVDKSNAICARQAMPIVQAIANNGIFLGTNLGTKGEGV